MPYIGNPIYQSAFVTDTFSGDGTTTAFTMSVAPAGTTNVLVAISGVLQDPSTYGVVGTTITFSTAPPSGTGNISCRYLGIPVTGVTTTAYRTVTEFTATAGQTTFTPPSYTVGFINVYRNGVLLGSADYTATNGTTVVLTTGATSGDLVTVESFLVSSVLNAIPATTGSVGTTYLADASVTQAKLGSVYQNSGPAFSAYKSASAGNQTITSGVATKVTFDTEEFDTNNNFASSTFTPTVAGYYQISTCFMPEPSTASVRTILCFYKNGSLISVPQDFSYTSASFQTYKTSASQLFYMNGTTDYLEVYVYIFASTAVIGYSQANTWFTGAMVRAA